MKLYYHPVSTTCRPIMLLAAAERIELDYQLIDLFSGAHLNEEFLKINPNGAVPLLEDDDFRLAESSTILKYLADKFHAASYPAELTARARVNERMDWFNTGLYRDLGYGLIYPQVIDTYRKGDEQAHRAHLAWSRDKAKHWLQLLDQHHIGPKKQFVCGNEPTLADFMGASYVTLGDVIHLDYSAYPNVTRWLGNMKSLPYWTKVNEAFYGHFVAPFKDKSFEGL
ncbi:MAG TPA: glutathione S-transferase family protein [Candidatus Binatus sp.]|nr:glutathione S-transferase family protein [Candidatus Binatus sp.]